MSKDIYWRLHWGDCPEFSAANAWSKPWIATAHPTDPSLHECVSCPYGDPAECDRCEDGWADNRLGYSCLDSAEGLRAYFAEWDSGLDTNDEFLASGARVITFTGRYVGRGDTDEMLVIPNAIVETMTWGEFVARAAA